MMNPLYLVEADFGRHGRAFVETDRDKNSWDQVVQDIADCQIENVLTVLEVVEDEGSCRNVTEDIARDVLNYLHENDRTVPLGLIDWLAHHCEPQKEAAE